MWVLSGVVIEVYSEVKFEDIKGVIRSCEEGHTISWSEEKGQKEKQWFRKHYTEN